MIMRVAKFFKLWINNGIFFKKADDKSGYLYDNQRKNNSPPNHSGVKTEGGHG